MNKKKIAMPARRQGKSAATKAAIGKLPADSLVVQYCAPEELIPYERNTKQHSDEQVQQLVSLMDQFGVTQPVVVDENMVLLMGHGRRLAFIARGMKRAPYIMRRGLSEAKKKALRLADNRVAENSTWDEDMLRVELKDLNDAGEIDLDQLGFDQDELVKHLQITGHEAPPQLGNSLTYSIIVECEGEAQQAELLERLSSEGLKVKPMMS